MARILVVAEDGTHTVELVHEDPYAEGDFDGEPYWTGWCTCRRFDLSERSRNGPIADAVAEAEVHVDHHH